MRSVQTQRSTHHHWSRASSACIGVAATLVDFPSLFCSIAHPLSCVPWLHGRYPLPRYYGRSDSHRAALRACAMNTACPRRVSLIPLLGLPTILSPTISATTEDRPAASGFAPAPTGFATRSKARPSTPTESSSQRLPPRGACVTDWSFSLRCSPPRITATQLRFNTPRLFAAGERTFTAPTQHHLRRTSAGVSPALFHSFRQRAGGDASAPRLI